LVRAAGEITARRATPNKELEPRLSFRFRPERCVASDSTAPFVRTAAFRTTVVGKQPSVGPWAAFAGMPRAKSQNGGNRHKRCRDRVERANETPARVFQKEM
jgi:hypothetical protein